MILEIERLNLADKTKQQLVTEIVEPLLLNDDRMRKIKGIFNSEVAAALNEKPSSLQCENTYIPELPNGNETGEFLALDLGGTNFRIMIVDLKDSKIIFEHFKYYHIEDEIRVSSGAKIYDFLAECLFSFLHAEEEVHQFLESRNLKWLPLGFTFSFPMKQHSLSSAELVTWTKTFNCRDVVGQCPVAHLNQAIKRVWRAKHQDERKDLKVEVLAVLNDTTGTLIQGATNDPRVKVGIILGTGSNAAYMERVEYVKHWETKPLDNEKTVVIDIEWGAFGDNGVLDFIKTSYDREVDDKSLLKGSFTFEKYIAGRYLGEVVRVVLKDLVDKGVLFHNAERSYVKFPSAWMFTTNYVSHIEDDSLKNTNGQIIEIFTNFNYRYNIDFNIDDIKIIKYVTSVVSQRAAKLVACCLSVILERLLGHGGRSSPVNGEEPIGIAVDGSLYKHHPRLKNWIEHFTDLLTIRPLNRGANAIGNGNGHGNGNVNGGVHGKYLTVDDISCPDNTTGHGHQTDFFLTLAEDGSGKGAAMSAAIAKRLRDAILIQG